MLRELLSLELTEQGHTVVIARNGEEAVTAMTMKEPDLVLLDLLMPRLDGYAVLQHVKDKGYRCPVVVLSNLSDFEEKDRCKVLGAADFIVKNDMDTEQLLGRIGEYLERAAV